MKITDQPPSYIRLPLVTAQVGLSKSSIYQMIASERFPAPKRIGARAVGWLQSEVTDWVIARAAAEPEIPAALRSVARLRAPKN